MKKKVAKGALNLDYEKALIAKGTDVVIGIDEVGRGCWAGPMYMTGFEIRVDSPLINGINDSKKISKLKRNDLYTKLASASYYTNKKSANEIDGVGLGKAINFALKEILEYYSKLYAEQNIKFLVDGNFAGDWDKNIEFIPKGDSKIYSIATASIIAKVERDNHMANLDKQFPKYGFKNHVGYGTKAHREALEKYGVLPVHRKSYKPIKKLMCNV